MAAEVKPRNSDSVCRELRGSFDENISREWLLTNGQGGYASGTVMGTGTRRYHGLLVVSRRPPLDRLVIWANTLDQLVVEGRTYEFPSFEFADAIHPRGHEWQTGFSYSAQPPRPWVRFTYRVGGGEDGVPMCIGIEVVKTLRLAEGRNVVELSYDVAAPEGLAVELNVLPFVAGRDFHSLLGGGDGCGWDVEQEDSAVWLKRWGFHETTLVIAGNADPADAEVHFDPARDWWYGFHYRQEAARGLDCREDLFSAGWFRSKGRGSYRLTLVGVGCPPDAETARKGIAWAADSRAEERESVDVKQGAQAPASLWGRVRSRLGSSEGELQDLRIARLYDAVDQFVVARELRDLRRSATILAGYPWFGDWGRDAFIALPGLLLTTGRYAEAREVLTTFASAQRNGLIPNLFDDYGGDCHYNSVDASLWFMRAADAYVEASGDLETWQSCLLPACVAMAEAFERGTDFDIAVDGDGLLRCGNAETQITWMDAKHGDVVFTPRDGKPVEINALWHHGLCVLAKRLAAARDDRAVDFERKARRVGEVFETVFWNEDTGGLYDCVRADGPDRAIRPNQIFAVSLEPSPLSRQRQRNVMRCVEEHLLTPYGLRTLSPADSRYRGRYEGGPFERDSAYHQGTVWPWLIGGFVEAYLRVHDFSPDARQHCRNLLEPLLEHVDEAGLGTISEVFDGDSPHRPGGCIAQAWSVAEVLRAWLLTQGGAAEAAAS